MINSFAYLAWHRATPADPWRVVTHGPSAAGESSVNGLVAHSHNSMNSWPADPYFGRRPGASGDSGGAAHILAKMSSRIASTTTATIAPLITVHVTAKE